MWRLLRKNISASQLTGFAIANLIGLTIVILAVQFYADVRPIFNDDDDRFIGRDYLVVTRKVTGMGAILGSSAQFSPADIADLECQPWVRKVGRFTTSAYSVHASVGLGGSGRSLSSQMFFESIPAEFIDVESDEWHFSPERPVVPVIVSKDYLSLYNFGFAAAQGMPKISEGMIGMIPLQFTLSGAGRSEVLPGRIVGFSSRLNTIVVPEEFMRWSNERYANGESAATSRIIVEVNTPGDMAIAQYMEEHGYEIAGDKLNSGKANYFLTVTTGIVIAVGALISLLSFFVLMLSIYLLLQKNMRKLQDLLLLGYTPAQVSAPYIRLVVAINASVLVLSVLLMIAARTAYQPMLEALGATGGSMLASIAVAVLVMGLITLGNIIAISHRISPLWHQESEE